MGIRTEEEQKVYDQIQEYLFTMKLDELKDVLQFIEEQEAGKE